MAYEFVVGKFQQGEGLEGALANAQQIVLAAALAQVGALKSAFLVGGHGDRGGEQWAPWSPKYARERARKGRSNILVDKGILRNSLHAGQPTPGPNYTVMIGTNVHYAKVHQFGFSDTIKRRAFAQSDIRKRGKWVKKKGGNLWEAATGQEMLRENGKWVQRERGMVFKKGKRQVGKWRHFEAWTGAMTIPPRPFLVMTDSDLSKAQSRIVRWADEALNGPGGALSLEVM